MTEPCDRPAQSLTVSRRDAAALVLLLLVAAGLRLSVIAVRWEHLARDPDAYRLIAENLCEYGVYSTSQAGTPIQPTAFRPPLYPMVLSTLAWQGRVTSPSVAALHLTLGLLTVLAVWILAQRWQLGRWSYLAATLVAADPILLNQSSEVMTETLATFLAVAGMLALTRFSDAPSWKSSLAAGIALGLATLCRPTFLVWMVLVLLWVVLCWGQRWLGVKRAVVILMGFCIVFVPWVIRNQQVMGRTILATTHGGYTLLLGNNPLFYRHLRTGRWGSVWDARDLLPLLESETTRAGHLEDRAGQGSKEHPEVVADRHFYQRARHTIDQDPVTFLYASAVRVFRLWTPIPHRLTENESVRRALARWGVALWYAFVFSIALFGLWWLGRRAVAPPWVWGLLCVLALTAVHTVYWSNMRMRAPAMPVVYLAFALGGRRIYEQDWIRKLFSRNKL